MTFQKYSAALILLFGALILPLAAQKSAKKPAPAARPAAPAGMTNDDVIALAGTGLPDEVIDAKIHAAPSTDFDTSVTGLKSLKAAGVSSGVIRYMIDPAAPATAPAAAVAAAPAASSPNDPAAVHSPGVYILATGKDGVVHLTKLDHITPKTVKTSGAFLSGMTYGLKKGHVKAQVDGGHANVETVDVNPVFYAYIPEDNNSFGGATISVRDLTLVKFDAKESAREINTASFSPWGASSGTDQNAKQGFSSETIKPGVYKLTLEQPLAPGQFAFQHQNFGAFFDFGVIPAK